MGRKRKKEYTEDSFFGIYKEIFEIVGAKGTIELHNHFNGQVMIFPSKLYSEDFIMQEVIEELENGKTMGQIATEKGYTVKYLQGKVRAYRKRLAENLKKNIEKE